MSIKTTVKIEGLNELRIRLRRLPEELQQKELGNAVARGAVVIRNEARSLAPVIAAGSAAVRAGRRLPGVLRRAIRSTRGVRRGSEASAFVSVRKLSAKAVAKFKKANRGTKSSENPQDPWYWRILEFSTNKRKRPFLRRAFENKKRAAAEEIKRALREGLDAVVRRLTR